MKDGGPIRLERWDPARDGALTEAALTQKLERKGFRVARYVYPPGTVFDFHRHPFDKWDAVLSGRFALTMDGHTVVLEPGDMLYVPHGVEHRAEVIGEAPVVSLDASPR